MRRGLALCGLVLCLVPAATAAPPTVTASADRAVGLQPFPVTLTAGGDAASFHWDFGDGTSGDGRVVQHTYPAGRWTATVTAATANGESSQAEVDVTSYAIRLATAERARWARRIVFRGSSEPALARVPVRLSLRGNRAARGRTRGDGTFALRARALAPGPWAVQVGELPEVSTALQIVPRLTTRVVGSGLVGHPLRLVARVQPADAGNLFVRVSRAGSTLVEATVEAPGGRVRLPTDRRGVVTARVSVLPNDAYLASVHVVHAAVGFPRVRYGASSSAVAQLTSQLARLHYAVPRTSHFNSPVLDAVYAFEKVARLPRTGAVDTRFWQRLASARVPSPRYTSPSNHLEVNKPLQVLFVVHGGRVASIAPVSTAGIPGHFTPVGRFSVYRKVGGFDPSPLGTLYDPLYFTGGYAIHGNPSVPPYPASHGCVRVPMWFAPRLYATVPYGERVYVY